MNIISVCALAVAAVIIIVTLKPKNAEVAVMLGIAACAVIGMLSAGIVFFLRSIDLAERENAAFESKPL